jgi:hypothetical protein
VAEVTSGPMPSPGMRVTRVRIFLFLLRIDN